MKDFEWMIPKKEPERPIWPFAKAKVMVMVMVMLMLMVMMAAEMTKSQMGNRLL